MSLMRLTRTPFDVIDRAFDNWSENMTRTLNWPSPFRSDSLIPKLDIAEDKENYYIITELPGVESKDVKITLENGNLTIKGSKEEKKEKKERDYHHVERSFGEFMRTASLPINIREEDIIANFENGLLEITVPKDGKVKSNAREIPVTKAAKAISNGKATTAS